MALPTELKTDKVMTVQVAADSDDLARVYRYDLAQDSEMISPHHSDLMSPGARGVLAVWFLASVKPRGQP